MRVAQLIVAVLLCWIALGCVAKPDYKTASDSMAGEAVASPTVAAPAQSPAAGAAPAIRNRKIIYTGDLTLQVEALEPAVAEAQQVARQFGGYLSSLNESGGAGRRYAELTFRLPAERFHDAMAALAKLGEVRGRTVGADDVTEQWVDLDARVRNLKRSEERLLKLLEQAGNISQLLEVERELTRVRGEIEAIEGQLRHLNDRIALSTLTVRLNLPPEIAATVDSGSWFRNTVSRATATFVGIGKALVKLLVYVAINAPYLALAAAAIWAWRKRRRGPVER